MASPEPFYQRHKVTELTCPHCLSMLTFLVNEKDKSIYSCKCGRWLKAIDWKITQEPAQWTYEPKEEYIHE